MNVGRGVRLGRMTQWNGGFHDWPFGQRTPSRWIHYDQVSYYLSSTLIQNPAPPLPGGISISLFCFSRAGNSVLGQFLDGYVGGQTEREPVDFYLDGLTHRFRFGAWLRPLSGAVNSGALYVAAVVYGNDANSSFTNAAYHSGAHRWEWVEAVSSRSFTGSSYNFGVVRTSTTSDYSLSVAYPRIVIDEISLYAGHDIEDRSQVLLVENSTRIGRSRYYRAAKPVWELPVTGVSSQDRSTIERWHLGSKPLALTMGADSPGLVNSVQLVGERTHLYRMDGADVDRWMGDLKLEGL